MKKYRNRIMLFSVISILLVLSYIWGGNIPPETETVIKTHEQNVTKKESISPDEEKIVETKENETEEKGQPFSKVAPEREETENILSESIKQQNISPEDTDDNIEYSFLQGMNINGETDTDKYQTQPVPEGRPAPVEPQSVTISDRKLSCTLSIRCDTLLDNIDYLDEEKRSLVPENGIILAEKQVTFFEGESVFNVLLRETRRNGIHLEFVNTPIYNSAYIEGIHNLYEFDCGELSGWMYSVNGWFPNYGCSRYGLKDGDKIEWVFTCNLGRDVTYQ